MTGSKFSIHGAARPMNATDTDRAGYIPSIHVERLSAVRVTMIVFGDKDQTIKRSTAAENLGPSSLRRHRRAASANCAHRSIFFPHTARPFSFREGDFQRVRSAGPVAPCQG